jgi:hypothetical protein
MSAIPHRFPMQNYRLRQLIETGYATENLPSSRSMSDILNRTEYRLRKVVKAKPLKKIKETDDIFENIKKKT